MKPRGPGILTSLVILAVIAAPASAGSTPSCPLLRDPAGDANENPSIQGPGTQLPVKSVPAGDILEADLAVSRTGVTAIIRLAKLDGPDSDSRTGYFYEFQGASAQGGRIGFGALDGVDGVSFSFGSAQAGLSTYGPQNHAIGAFDRLRKEIHITVSWNVLAGYGLTPSGVLKDIRVASYRYIGNSVTGGVTPVLDRASANRNVVFSKEDCANA